MFKRLELILVVVGLFITFGIYAEGLRMNRVAAKAEFQRVTEDGMQALQTRMNIYLQSLNGAAGLMQASENIEFDDYELFVKSLDLQKHLPGINGIGFIQAVPRAEEAAFVADLHANGVPDFAVHPETDSAVKFIIKYIAPVNTNKQAVGLDISFESGRREAAERARATGLPQLTPRILLVQDETNQPGFLLLRPLFDNKGAQQGDFLGWVYAPFVGRNLMQDLTPDQNKIYDFEVFDATSTDPMTLIYGSDIDDDTVGRYQAQYTVDFFGRPWTVQYKSTKLFDAAFPMRAPVFALIAGILLTAMLAVALRAMRLRNDSLAEIAAMRGQQISAREEENRSIVENTVVAVIILDEKRDILFANHAAIECFGSHDVGMEGLPFEEFVTEVKNLPVDAGYNAKGKTPSGKELYLDLQQNGWVTLNGVRRVTAIVRDVTAEVIAVAELAITKQRYDIALAGSRIGVFEVDLKAGTSVVSQTWRDIMDVAREVDDTQDMFLNRIHPDDLPRFFESDRKCINGETDRSVCEYRLRFGDSWRWMKSDAVVIERASDGVALRMVGTQVDVTDLLHSRNALEASEKRFRTVLDAAPVGMATFDSNGMFTSVNAAMCELTGYDEEYLLKGTSLTLLVPAEDMRRMRKAVSRSTKRGFQDVYREEHKILHKEGGERWGLFNITWTYDKNADAYVYIAQVNDITDKKQMEQIKSEFVSTVSHELRTPLTSIKGALGLIDVSARDKLPASALRLIEIARTNADRLTDIVNDILDLEKISSGEISFNLMHLDINAVVEASVQEMMPFAVTHNNTLAVDLPDTPVTITADRGRVMQVLANLISNACKYSNDDTKVTVKVEQLEDVAIVYVQNTGPGVPESFKGRIFQAFSQADGSDTRARGGTGLGLNITRQIVWRQGGNIGFESKPGGTTVFWFTCPVAQTDSVVEPAQLFSPRGIGDRRLKILHVEDDEDFAEVIKAGLSPFADVKNVTRLGAARKALQTGIWDVIILDWTIPDGDASSLLDEVGRKHPAARIVSLTSDGARKPDGRVTAHLIKSQTELPDIIQCVTDLSKLAS